MTPAQIQALIDACRTGPSDLVMWAELKAVLEGLKNQDGVTSFNGRDGIVVGEEGDYNLSDMGDVVISVPTTNQILRYDGSDWVNDDETVYVPYTGATANVNLGEYGIKAGWYGFDLTPTGTPTDQGTMYWDDSRSTVALIMNGTTQHIGQDQFYYVKNSTGTSIPKGTAVGFAGADGGSGRLLIKPFRANGVEPSSYFMGVTAEAIADGAFGQVMSFGKLRGIDTSAYSAGDILYASTATAGAFQTTVPTAPNNIIQVATVVRSANNGTISVRPTLGSKLTSDESVVISSPTNGQVLQYNSTAGVWQNATISTSNIYTADGTLTGNRTVTFGGFNLDFSGTGALRILTTSGESFVNRASAALGRAAVNGLAYAVVYNSSAGGFVGLQQRDGTSARYGVNGMSELTSSGTGGLAIVSASGAVHLGTSTNEMMRLFTTGNVLIQTGGTFTDAGFRLDVNGTARVQSNLTVTKGASNFITFDANANGSAPYIQGFFSGSFDGRIRMNQGQNVGRITIASGFDVHNQTASSFAGFYAGSIAITNGLLGITSTGAFQTEINISYSNAGAGVISFRENGVADRGIIGYVNGSAALQIRVNGATNTSNGTLSTLFFSSGNVGIGTSTDVASSILTLASTTKGFLMPRMTTTERNAISSPATGLIVYDTTDNEFDYYNGTAWVGIRSFYSNNGTLTANRTITDGGFTTTFTGSVFLASSTGRVGIGATSDTSYLLSVDGDLRVYGNLRTATPTGGTAPGVWRLGSTATGTFTVDTGICVEVEIGGTLRKLAVVS